MDEDGLRSATERAKSIDSSRLLGVSLKRGYTRGAGASPIPGSALRRAKFVSPQSRTLGRSAKVHSADTKKGSKSSVTGAVKGNTIKP